MPTSTERALAQSLAMESIAAARHEMMAQRADQEGKINMARLLRALAEAEKVHVRRYLRLSRGKIGTTEENLERIFSEEMPAMLREYDSQGSMAETEGSRAALTALSHSRQVQSRHEALYRRALGQDLSPEASAYYVCQVCGFVATDQAPQHCPVCGAVHAKFNPIT